MSMCEEDLKMIQDLVKAGKEIEKRWVEGKRIVKKKRKKKWPDYRLGPTCFAKEGYCFGGY